MTKRLTAVLTLSLALITSACGSSMKNPDIKQNPNPVKRYEVTMTIDGAPGPFDSVDGFMGFDVKNDACVPLTKFSGARLPPEKSVPFVLRQISGNVYRGVIYMDLLQDEDYYGLGVCHWSLTSVGAVLTKAKVGFTLSLSQGDLEAHKPATNYFTIASYNDPKMQGGDTGTVRTEYVSQHPNEFFSVEIDAKEVSSGSSLN